MPDPAALARQLALLLDGLRARGLVDHTGTAVADVRAAVEALVLGQGIGRRSQPPGA